jgi:hypothetical protein
MNMDQYGGSMLGISQEKIGLANERNHRGLKPTQFGGAQRCD